MKTSALFLAAALALARADDIPSCGEGKDACPEKYPCCSVDGTCGNGYVCLGGCDPRFSFTAGSCMPMPVCSAGSTTFTSTDQITPYADYMGDADSNPWSYLGNITEVDGKLRAQMYANSGGTAISSSHYIWYGKISIKFKTSHLQGVISDVILLSSVKDELDYEMVGSDTSEVQTNWYWHGNLDYTKGQHISVSSDTYNNYHTYEIDWQEDQTSWSIDGSVVRTLKKSDTYNTTSNSYAYPQTPARLQFGLWPGGASSQGEGTIEWAGGDIDWSASDITGDPGYYYVEIESVDISCYDAPSGTQTNGSKAYVYNSKDGMQTDVAITDDSTILESTDGTGTNPKGSLADSDSSASSSAGGAFTLSGVSISSSTVKSNQVLSGASAKASSSSSSSVRSGVVLSGASYASSSVASSSAAASSSVASSSAAASSSGAASSAAGSSSTAGSHSSSTGAAAGTATASATASSSRSSTAAAASGSSSSSGSAAGNGAAALVPAALAAVVPVAMLL